MTSEELIKNVKKAIHPKFNTWVLFSNGTYVIVEDSSVIDKRQYALDQIKMFGPVQIGTPAGDFNTTKLSLLDGWSIGGHGYGMYTYVDATEIQKANPTDIEVGVFGRRKRDQDSKDMTIIYMSE